MDEIGEATNRLLLRRITVFLGLILFANTIDRVNISFAALRMNADIGLSADEYGFGVGIFFVSYILCQIPIVAFAERIGLVRALGGMAIVWGLVSSAMFFVRDKESFYALRFLLGIAEAGVSPVILLYSSRWCTPEIAARFISATALALPASFVLGAPVSGWLMETLDGIGGVAGWRWMYAVEGLFPVVLGIVTFFWLSETPREARWLSAAQRAWLEAARGDIARDEAAGAAPDGWGRRLVKTLRDRRVWILGLVMFCNSMGFYGFLYWLPQVVSLLTPGSSAFFVLVISALPWISAALGMILVGRHSDRHRERHVHVAGSAMLAASCLLVAAFAPSPVISLAALVVAGFGVGAAQSIFYSIPFAALQGSATLGMALAVISLLANSAGLIGGNLIGLLRAATGSFAAAIAALALSYVVGAVILLRLRAIDRRTPIA